MINIIIISVFFVNEIYLKSTPTAELKLILLQFQG